MRGKTTPRQWRERGDTGRRAGGPGRGLGGGAAALGWALLIRERGGKKKKSRSDPLTARGSLLFFFFSKISTPQPRNSKDSKRFAPRSCERSFHREHRGFSPFCTLLTEAQGLQQGEVGFSPTTTKKQHLVRGANEKKSVQINNELSTHAMLFLAEDNLVIMVTYCLYPSGTCLRFSCYFPYALFNMQRSRFCSERERKFSCL